jgi:hypothetical protein
MVGTISADCWGFRASVRGGHRPRNVGIGLAERVDFVDNVDHCYSVTVNDMDLSDVPRHSDR